MLFRTEWKKTISKEKNNKGEDVELFTKGAIDILSQNFYATVFIILVDGEEKVSTIDGAWALRKFNELTNC